MSITGQDDLHNGSGVIITSRHVLTSAQCIATVSSPEVMVLEYNLLVEDSRQFGESMIVQISIMENIALQFTRKCKEKKMGIKIFYTSLFILNVKDNL